MQEKCAELENMQELAKARKLRRLDEADEVKALVKVRLENI